MRGGGFGEASLVRRVQGRRVGGGGCGEVRWDGWWGGGDGCGETGEVTRVWRGGCGEASAVGRMVGAVRWGGE